MSGEQPERDDDEAEQQAVDASREGREQSQAMNRMADGPVRPRVVGASSAVPWRARACERGAGRAAVSSSSSSPAPSSLSLPPFPRPIHTINDDTPQTTQEREIQLDANKVQKVRRSPKKERSRRRASGGGGSSARALSLSIDRSSPKKLTRRHFVDKRTTNRRCWH